MIGSIYYPLIIFILTLQRPDRMLKGSSFRVLYLDIYANIQRELTHIYPRIEKLHILLRVHIHVFR